MILKILLTAGLIIGLLIFSLIGYAEVDRWTRKIDMPTARLSLSTSEVSGRIYAIGGMICGNGPCTVLQVVEEYDPITDEWTEKESMPTARDFLGTASVDGKIYAVGGRISDNSSSSVVEEYDPERDLWEKKENMIIERYGLATVALKGRIYAIGGATALVNVNNKLIPRTTSAVEEYDSSLDRWTMKADMPTKRYGFAADAVKNKIYCIGGINYDDNNKNVLSSVEEYDPILDKWTKKADMPTKRYDIASAVVNDKIYCIGGRNDIVGYLSTVEEYDPVLDKWTKKADMPTERSNLAAGSVNGKIYVIGGVNPKVFILSTVEEYDTGFTGTGVDTKDKLTINWGEIKKYDHLQIQN